MQRRMGFKKELGTTEIDLVPAWWASHVPHKLDMRGCLSMLSLLRLHPELLEHCCTDSVRVFRLQELLV